MPEKIIVSSIQDAETKAAAAANVEASSLLAHNKGFLATWWPVFACAAAFAALLLLYRH